MRWDRRHHRAHDVLDQEDRHAASVDAPAPARRSAPVSVRLEPRHHLVEQQQPRARWPSARASSSRLRSASGEAPARRARRGPPGRPAPAPRGRAPRRCADIGRARPSAPTLTLSQHASGAGTAARSGTCGPAPAGRPACGLSPRERRARRSGPRPRPATRKPEMQVEHGRLARAVGADEPHDLALAHLEREIPHRLQAAEALGQARGLRGARLGCSGVAFIGRRRWPTGGGGMDRRPAAGTAPRRPAARRRR